MVNYFRFLLLLNLDLLLFPPFESYENTMIYATYIYTFKALEEDKLCTKNIGLSVVDYEEVKASLDRINRRIDAVQVRILTSRDLEQTKSLEKIHDIIR